MGVISKVDIKRSFKKRLRRFKNSITKKTIFVTAAVAIFLGSCLGWYINRQIQVRNAANSITSIVEAYGLSDVTVDLRRISNDGRKHWYYADVTCSNWGELKPSKMLQTYQEMENSVGSKIKVCKERVSLGNIYSGDDCYEVYTSLKSVYKNKDVIYKGYVPSMSAPKHGSSSASSKIDEIPQESKNALQGQNVIITTWICPRRKSASSLNMKAMKRRDRLRYEESNLRTSPSKRPQTEQKPLAVFSCLDVYFVKTEYTNK